MTFHKYEIIEKLYGLKTFLQTLNFMRKLYYNENVKKLQIKNNVYKITKTIKICEK